MTFYTDILNTILANTLMDYLVALAIIFALIIIGPLVSSTLIRLFHVKEKKLLKIKKHAFYKPLKHFFIVLGVYIAVKTLTIPNDFGLFVDTTFRIITIILVANAFANLFNTTSNNSSTAKKLFNFTGNDALINFVSKIVRAIIYIIAIFIIINELGYNLSGLFAGLGIFSAVIALAAQDVAKNIIAGCSIITDKPFDIGDYVEIDSIPGTVEDITFRSTRIRNPENQVVVIPNSKVTDSIVINYNEMKKRRFYLCLTLELSTELPKVIALLDKIKSMLQQNDFVVQENIKVYFKTVSSNGIDILVDFYTSIVDYMSFIQFKHEMNYDILDLIQKENIELAYNTQTLYLKKDSNYSE